MKKLILLLMASICLLSNATAEKKEYMERGCDCDQVACVCFMQMDDFGLPVKVMIEALKENGYLNDAIDATFVPEVEDAVKAVQSEYGLKQTGLVDDNTLTCLLWGISAEELDAARPDLPLKMVWVPTDGGKKYHNKKTCSQMYDPRKISQRNAIVLGIEPCGRCAKADKSITYDSIIENND